MNKHNSNVIHPANVYYIHATNPRGVGLGNELWPELTYRKIGKVSK